MTNLPVSVAGPSQAGLVRRTARWIQGWHGAQVLTLWAACLLVPWQVGFWRQLLVSSRLEPFLNPGDTPGGRTLLAGLLAYAVAPILALIVGGIWLRARIGRGAASRR